jgi:hypothetical protein
VDTLYPQPQFYYQNLFLRDDDRLKINNAMGNYANGTQRNLQATAATSYYVDLWTLYDQASIPHLFQTSDLQIRVYMDTLPNSINVGTLTGTPSCTIQSANLIAKITRHSSAMSNYVIQKITRQPHHFQFTETRYGYFSLNAGSGPTVQLVLSSITGPVAFLMFTVRTSGVNLAEFNPGPITSFAILDNSSTNITGGQDIPAALNLYIMSRDWTKSSYTTEAIVQNSTVGSYVYF